MREAARKKPQRPPPSFFQSLFPCLLNPRHPLAAPRLIDQQEKLLALAHFKYDDMPEIFHEILAEAYKRLTGSLGSVAYTGSHWEEIGFQRSNPSTDIRSGGALGPLCLLSMTEQYPQTMSHIYKISIHPVKHFPLACKIFEVSSLCMARVKNDPEENGMNILFNQHRDIYNTFMMLVASCFFKLMFGYRK